ncbi:MAG TPA: hypothetical protein VLI65_08875 [Pyrinomonadaceae bacterium]|nr:hypothetical protein [Pyrinomonadaceae bacterium]
MFSLSGFWDFGIYGLGHVFKPGSTGLNWEISVTQGLSAKAFPN